MYKKLFLTILLISASQQSNAMLSQLKSALPVTIGLGVVAFAAENGANTAFTFLVKTFGSNENKRVIASLAKKPNK